MVRNKKLKNHLLKFAPKRLKKAKRQKIEKSKAINEECIDSFKFILQ
jgi:hypothetical protein